VGYLTFRSRNSDGDEYCEEHAAWYDSEKYSSCYYCYLERRRDYIDCIFCGRWHSPAYDTCFKCRQITDRDEAGRELRRSILIRDSFECRYCGDDQNLEVDHIKPCKSGGKADPWNLQILCSECNWLKGSTWWESDTCAYYRDRQEVVHAYYTYLWQYLTQEEQTRLQRDVDDWLQPDQQGEIVFRTGITPAGKAKLLAWVEAGRPGL
jgi:5-methylcytosine-specific restriction endonuclease McrA